MRTEFLGIKGTWAQVKAACRTTINKEGSGIEADSEWKRELLLSEHSPIRKIILTWRWVGIPYWVSTHFVRHKLGIEHWIGTQRTDRTGVDRKDLGQAALVNHEAEANAQALITISRKRLCYGASVETRQAWQLVKDDVEIVLPELASCMVKDCIYRGYCYEVNSCGYHKTSEFISELNNYRKGINS